MTQSLGRSSCNHEQCCCKPTVYRTAEYRRVIPNNDRLQYWKTRNCSEQMNSILNPSDDSDSNDDYDVKTCCTTESGQIGVHKSSSKIRWGKLTSSRYHNKCVNGNNKNNKNKLNKKVKPKRNIATKTCDPEKDKLQKFVNECYCYNPPKRPLLPTKLSIDDLIQNRKEQFKSSHSLETVRKAKPLLEYCPETKFLQNIRKEAEDYYSCDCSTCKIKSFVDNLKYTKNRTDLEDAYRTVESTLFNYGDSDLISLDREIKMEKNNKENDSKIEEILKDPTKIKNVKEFRAKNYFETHSAKDSAPCEVPKHKCVHKFTVDDRLLPTPLNPDGFGNSRCTICSKIMQQQNENQSSIRNSSAKATKAPSYDEYSSIYSNAVTNSKTKDNLECLFAPSKDRKVYRDNKNSEDLKIQISQLINDSPKTTPVYHTSTSLPKMTSAPKPPRRISNTIIIEQDESELITQKNKRPTLTVYNANSPRKITIGGTDDIIELQITPSLLSTNNQPVKIQRNRVPRDSFALRYQKGVV